MELHGSMRVQFTEEGLRVLRELEQKLPPLRIPIRSATLDGKDLGITAIDGAVLEVDSRRG